MIVRSDPTASVDLLFAEYTWQTSDCSSREQEPGMVKSNSLFTMVIDKRVFLKKKDFYVQSLPKRGAILDLIIYVHILFNSDTPSHTE